MTSEEFRQQYHLLDRVGQGPVATHHAQSATGTMVVMVHFLQGTEQENSRVLRDLAALDAAHRARVLKVVDVDGQTTIVTKFILDFTTFDEWLASGIQPAAASGVVEPQSAEPATEPAASSSPFAAAEHPLMSEEPPPSAPQEVLRAPSPSPMPTPEPGEFTRVFNAPPLPRTAASPASNLSPPSPAPPDTAKSPSDSGEFTRLFRGLPVESLAQPLPPDEPRPSLPAATESSRPPGSVEQRPAVSPLASKLPPARMPLPPSPAPPQPSPDSFEWPGLASDPAVGAESVGEYTRLFGKGTTPPSAPTATGSVSISGGSSPKPDWLLQGSTFQPGREDTYIQRLAGGLGAPSNEASVSKESSMPQSFPGRSEYTRIISSPLPMTTLGAPPNRSGQAAASSTASPEKKSGDRVLLFSLIGVVVLAVVFVIVFALVK